MSKYTEWLARSGPGNPLAAGKHSTAPAVVRLVEHNVTFDVLEGVDNPVPPEVAARQPELIDLLYEDPSEALPRIEAMLAQFPDECHLLNFYANALSATGQEHRSVEMTERNYRLHPNYLFARINYAELLIVSGRHEEVRAVLGGDFDLQRMYPHRKVFHFTEIIGFYGLMGRYSLALGDVDSAKKCLQMLRKLDPDHHMTHVLSGQVAAALLMGALQKVRSKLPSASTDANSTSIAAATRSARGGE